MDRITLPRTERSPEVDFDFASGRLVLRGESYPEDAAAVAAPGEAGDVARPRR